MIKQILKAAHDRIRDTNVVATTAYLGKTEYRKAKQECEPYMRYRSSSSDGFWIAGLKIIEVNEDSYFKVV